MIVELKGKIKELTESQYFGAPDAQKEAYWLVLVKRYIDQNDEEQVNEYAIKVFVNGDKNTRNSLAKFIDKSVVCKLKIGSSPYTNKHGKRDYMTNMTLRDIQIVENKMAQGAEKTGTMNFNEKPEKEEVKTLENESDDLPF